MKIGAETVRHVARLAELAVAGADAGGVGAAGAGAVGVVGVGDREGLDVDAGARALVVGDGEPVADSGRVHRVARGRQVTVDGWQRPTKKP